MNYVTIQEAQAYFDDRLHEVAWSLSNASDQSKSLQAATRIIDTLRYKNCKNSVFLLVESDPELVDRAARGDSDALQQLRDAEHSQENEFPRGADTEIVQTIQWACLEIAYALLDGVDPDLELENLTVSAHNITNVKTTFNRTQQPPEHITNGVPSATAWKWLRPFLRDGDHVRITRGS